MSENQIERYLITTADENTWKFDRPVVFLGRWCQRYDRKHIWGNMDAATADPYGLGMELKDKNFALARQIENTLFNAICPLLNGFHETDNSQRFWRIIIGHWLRRYVELMINRIRTLQECLKTYRITGTTIYAIDEYELATIDSDSAVWASNNDRWNNGLYARILILLGEGKLIKDFISDKSIISFNRPQVAGKDTLKKKIRHHLYNLVISFLGLFRRNTDGFIINSYLNRNENIKLYLKLKQVPQFIATPSYITHITPDHVQRKELADKLSIETPDELISIIYTLVFELMPICFLEGFDEILENIKKLRWPNNPSFIFTSNNFDTDELFKTWAAQHAESGIKYITGQHGNNYGTYRYMNPAIEEITPDKFLTWGWTDGLSQHTPAFIFKTAGNLHRKRNRLGGLILIEDMLYQRVDTWDRAEEFELFFNEQVEFVNGLSEDIRKMLTIRLHHTHRFLPSFEIMRWNDCDKNLNVDPGLVDISGLIDDSRLVVFSYDSTGMLETLSQNIPTMAFWMNELKHLRESAKPYYQLLADAGIVHFTPQSIARTINQVWDDIDSWWASDDVQSARIKFCQRYARTTNNPASELAKLLRSDS